MSPAEPRRLTEQELKRFKGDKSAEPEPDTLYVEQQSCGGCQFKGGKCHGVERILCLGMLKPCLVPVDMVEHLTNIQGGASVSHGGDDGEG